MEGLRLLGNYGCRVGDVSETQCAYWESASVLSADVGEA